MSVQQYGRFETEFRHAPVPGDPFTAVSLTAEFLSPGGSAVNIDGFYDGADCWKLRFMPDTPGVWHFRASFSDGAAAGEGSFECVPGDLPGVIGADPSNPLWFGFSSGRHFFMRSFHTGDCFFAENWPQTSRRAFLDWAQEQGYNTLSVASFFVNRQSYRRGMGWKTPSLWPLDPAEYRKAERILDDLAERRIIVFPFAGFFGREGFNPNAHRDQERYVRYVLARWGCYWNLLFNVAGPEPLLDVNPFMPRGEVDRLGMLIRKYDGYHHALTVHHQTGDDQFRDAPYQTFTTLQGPKTVDLSVLRSGLLRNHPASAPLYAQETLWTDNMYGHPRYDDTQLRRNAFVIALSAAALNYGDMNGDSSSGFSGQPELQLRRQDRHDIVRRVWDRVSSFPYYEMVPDEQVVDDAYALADHAGGRYLAFSSGTRLLKWHLPEDGQYRALLIDAEHDSEWGELFFEEELKLPDERDWLLYVTRQPVHTCVQEKKT